MTFPIQPNDVLWTRNGDPVLVNRINDKSGEIYTDENFEHIQQETKNGIKNGLPVPDRAAYKVTMVNIQNPNTKMEIDELYNKIKSLKQSQNPNMKVLKYLENELQFRMIRENYKPNDYEINPVTLDI